MASPTSELTLSFEGELYVFPAATPEKVQAVLLLLGGPDVLTGLPTIEVPCNQNNRGMSETPKHPNLSWRIACLVRCREKQKERCFDKKIRYTVRKEVVQRSRTLSFHGRGSSGIRCLPKQRSWHGQLHW